MNQESPNPEYVEQMEAERVRNQYRWDVRAARTIAYLGEFLPQAVVGRGDHLSSEVATSEIFMLTEAEKEDSERSARVNSPKVQP